VVEDAMTAEQARTERETTQAWSDLVMAGPVGRFYELEDVERIDVDAVRLYDGYEYRYHRGGHFTWFSKSTGEELPVRDRRPLPQHTWLHLPGCACAACAPT
jgi:hypothetical protein